MCEAREVIGSNPDDGSVCPFSFVIKTRRVDMPIPNLGTIDTVVA